MAKKEKKTEGTQPIRLVEERAFQIAEKLGLELVEVTLQKDNRGKCLCVYADKEGGLSLDDCEHFHKQLQPLLEDIDYDIMEVSSPGLDRPVKTQRDFEKKRGDVVEVHLFVPQFGQKIFRGILDDMNESTVTILCEEGKHLTFERRVVSLIKPVIELDEDDFEDVIFAENEAEEIEI